MKMLAAKTVPKDAREIRSVTILSQIALRIAINTNTYMYLTL